MKIYEYFSLWFLFLGLQIGQQELFAHEPAHEAAKAPEQTAVERLKESQLKLKELEDSHNLQEKELAPERTYTFSEDQARRARLLETQRQLESNRNAFNKDAQAFVESSKIPESEKNRVIEDIKQNPETLDKYLAYAKKLETAFVAVSIPRDKPQGYAGFKLQADKLWTTIKANLAETFGAKNKALEYREKLSTLNKALGNVRGEIAANKDLARLYQDLGNIEDALQKHQNVVSMITASNQFTQEEIVDAVANIMTLRDIVARNAENNKTFTQLILSIQDYLGNLGLNIGKVTMTRAQAIDMLTDKNPADISNVEAFARGYKTRTPEEVYEAEKRHASLDKLRLLEAAKEIYDKKLESLSYIETYPMTVEEKADYALKKAKQIEAEFPGLPS